MLAVAAGVLLPSTAALAATPDYSGCTNYQKTFPHGVGKRTARDKTSGTPVTTRKDDAEYKRAMDKRPGLDRDKGGIACEKK